MRIVFFMPHLRGGGAERVAVNLARAFTERGHRAQMALSQAEGPYLKDLPPSVRVIDLRAPRTLSAIPRFALHLRQERPDAILAFMLYHNLGALFARWLARAPARVVLTEHNTLTLSQQDDPNPIARWMPTLMRWFYPMSDAIVAVSQGVAQDLARYTGIPIEQIRVVYNPVITPLLYRLRDEPTAHPWLEDPSVPVVLAVGRLTRQKGFDILLDAFHRVAQVRPARLLILGEGEDRPLLEAKIARLGLQSVVQMPGFVQNPYAFMRRASVFVLSSRWEGLPTVLIEALACGCPVVSTDCPSGPREILGNGRYGHLVPVGDVDALANAILEVLSGGGKPVPPDWLKQFEESHVVEQYLSLLRGDL
ncbi:Glycosyltransferase involved in cell wall bisynthesis [Armatimonadetes bacterium GXS]|nr:Glycosyltransferase involved in cell wall bisynthesis [Armatimonadetes bacterium GXS]